MCILFKKLPNNMVQCTACNHYCKIPLSKTGICGVRQNKNGKLFLLVYGLTSGIGIDDVEKKPFFHFLPTSPVYSIGTIGCNFGCDFCQNAWMSQPTKDHNISIPPLYQLTPVKIVKDCRRKNIKIIAYTYNEPAVFFEYAYDTSRLAHKQGVKNVFVSNGYMSKEAVDKISPYLDAINIDLKSFSEDFYMKVCKARLKPVLETIKRFHQKGIWVEITTLLIPGENDSTKELTKLADFITSISKSIPWHVTRFTPAYNMQDKSETPESTIKKAYKIGKKAGLKYVYAGNITSEDLHSTFCPKCSTILIKRDWGYTKVENLKNGKCAKCGEEIEGVWK